MARHQRCSSQDLSCHGFICVSSNCMEMEIVAMAQKPLRLPGKLKSTVSSSEFFNDMHCTHVLCSFFPTFLQPAISVLVNPFYTFFLRIGIVKPHANVKSSAHSLTSVVSVQNVDMHDMERRRQIALKALSERLSRTTDSSRQKILPKSFPYHQHAHGHGHGHGHQHGAQHNFSDSDQPPFIAPTKSPMEFTIPAIPLPPPPSMQEHAQIEQTSTQSSISNAPINLNVQ